MSFYYEIYTETYAWKSPPDLRDPETIKFIGETIDNHWTEIEDEIDTKDADIVSHSVSVNSEVITLSVMVRVATLALETVSVPPFRD